MRFLGKSDGSGIVEPPDACPVKINQNQVEERKMRVVARFFWASLFAILIMVNLTAFTSADDPTETISGMVVAAGWNDDGDVTAVAINVITYVDDSETGESQEVAEDFLVGDTEKGRELLNMVSDEVEVTGVVKEDEDGNKTILVSAYKLVEPSGEESEE